MRSEELATSGMALDKVELCGRHINVGRPKGYVEPPQGAQPSGNLGMAQVPTPPPPPPGQAPFPCPQISLTGLVPVCFTQHHITFTAQHELKPLSIVPACPGQPLMHVQGSPKAIMANQVELLRQVLQSLAL